MLPRVLEPEVMDTPEEARDYDSMDHRGVNRLFVDHLLQAAGLAGFSAPTLQTLDVGTGTAQIPIELCGRGAALRSEWQVTAIDLAQEMLTLGNANVAAAGLSCFISLELADAKGLSYVESSFDVVMSNSIIHHIPKPLECLREMVRVTRSGGLLFVRDLMRPPDLDTLNRLVKTYASDANAHQQKMFGESLHAALTLDEIRGLMQKLGLDPACAVASSDRHWTIAARIG
jgi:ubiquinone/menaquinone biosynthesis C-methylase UbiE